MPNEDHHLAEEAAAAAEASLRTGDIAAARSHYLEAAHIELLSVGKIPSSEPRTRAILAVSSVSLFLKASALEQAEHNAYGFLADENLPAFAQDQLREALEAIWEQRAMQASQRQYSGEVVSVALRGSEIGPGRAPLGLVVDRIMGVNSLLYRITEWLGHFPLRTRGAPLDRVRELCQPWVSEAQAGSYRFDLHLVEPMQLELLPTRSVRPIEISGLLLSIVRAVSPTTVRSVASLQDLVPDTQYRQAMLKLVRNVVPDGKRVREIEFLAARDGQPDIALLHAGARSRIQDALRAEQPSDQPDHVQGVLRAVHLDKKWLEVAIEPLGQPLRCRIAGDVLDDVVGPMLNHRVIVQGKRTKSGAEFRLQDIELDMSPEP